MTPAVDKALYKFNDSVTETIKDKVLVEDESQNELKLYFVYEASKQPTTPEETTPQQPTNNSPAVNTGDNVNGVTMILLIVSGAMVLIIVARKKKKEV